MAGRLETEPNVWLATTRPDGRPHLVPIWFTWVDGAFWIATGATSTKVRNLHADPRAAVSLEDGNRPLVAETTARLVPQPFPRAVVQAFAAKYGWDIDVEVDDDIGEVALLELRVDRWLLGGPDA